MATDLDISSLPSSDSMNLVRSIVKLCSDVEQAVQSLVRAQIAKISGRIQADLLQDRFYRMMRFPFTIDLKNRRLSPTEIHRIRRAMWRLRLYYLAFHEVQPPADDGFDEAEMEHIESQRDFFSRMAVWELEKLECARFHFRYQSPSLWLQSCPFCQKKSPLADLSARTRQCAANDKIKCGRVCNLADAISWFNMEIEIFGEDDDLAARTDPFVRHPNAGFDFLRRHDEFYPRRMPGEPRYGLLEWGYCMESREA